MEGGPGAELGAPRSWTGKETGFPVEPPEGASPAHALILGLLTPAPGDIVCVFNSLNLQ